MQTTIRRCIAAAIFAFAYHAAPLWAESPDLPFDDPEQTIADAIEKCQQANSGKDFGIATVEQWCQIKAHAILGEKYPTLAQRLVSTARELDKVRTRAAKLKARNNKLTAQLGTLKSKRNVWRSKARTRWRTWKVVGIAVGSTAVGVGLGFAIFKLAE